MKKIYNLLLIFLAGLLAACNVMNDKTDLGSVSEEDVWDDPVLVTAFMNALYTYIPGYEDYGVSDYSDEAYGSSSWTNGTLTPDNPIWYWPYSSIRNCNIFINTVSDREVTTVDEDLAKRLEHEARFVRAYLYFEMVKRYGGVPLITVAQTLDDDIYPKRESTKNCFEFIFNELEACIEVLPDSYDSNELGRVTKTAVKAFLGRVWLYRASKQFNPNDNSELWQTAYNKNKEAYEYALSQGYKLYDDYFNLFLDEMNVEVLFANRYIYPNRTHGRDRAVRPIRFSQNASGGCQPIQEVIDAYPTADGKKFTINDLQPGDEIFKLWENRDNRFYATVIYQGVTYFGEEMELHANADNDYAYSKNIGTKTGYFSQKAIDQSLSNVEAATSGTDFQDIRLGEVMLNYAEAAVEVGQLSEAFEMLKQIRARAGIAETVTGDPELTGKLYGLDPNMSQNEMHQAVRDERYVELLYEHKRLWDLRRWWIYHEVMNGTGKRHALVMTKEEDGSLSWYLHDKDEIAMTTDERIYFLPMKRDEMTKNPNLQQTKGWENGDFDPQEGL